MKPTDFLSNGQVNMAKVQELIDRLGHVMNRNYDETYAVYLTRRAEQLNKKLAETGERGHEVLVQKSGIWAVARDADEILKAAD